jgi:hypothetical protein
MPHQGGALGVCAARESGLDAKGVAEPVTVVVDRR